MTSSARPAVGQVKWRGPGRIPASTTGVSVPAANPACAGAAAPATTAIGSAAAAATAAAIATTAAAVRTAPTCAPQRQASRPGILQYGGTGRGGGGVRSRRCAAYGGTG